MNRSSRKLLLAHLCIFIFLMVPAGMILAQEADSEKQVQAKTAYNEGLEAMKAGNVETAVANFTAAIQFDPNFVDAYMNLGAAYFDLKGYDLAMDNFRQAADKQPDNVDAWANLGRVQNQLKQRAEAEESFRTAASLQPDNTDILVEFGKILYARKKYDEAIQTLSKAHTGGTGDHVSYYYLGKAYQKASQLGNAVEALQQSIKIKGNNYNSHFALGSIYQSQEKFLKAADEFKAALRANPKRGYKASYNFAIAMEQSNPDDIDANVVNWQAYVKMAKNNSREKGNVEIAEQHISDLKERQEKLKYQ